MTALTSCVFLPNYKPTLFSLPCKTFRALLVFWCVMKTALRNNSWIMTIAFALIELPIIIFLSYFSLGSKEDVMEIYHSNPFGIILIKGAVSFVVTLFVTSLAMLLLAIIKRILLNVKTAREKLFTSLLLNLIVIIIEIIGVLTHKLMTSGYI